MTAGTLAFESAFRAVITLCVGILLIIHLPQSFELLSIVLTVAKARRLIRLYFYLELMLLLSDEIGNYRA